VADGLDRNISSTPVSTIKTEKKRRGFVFGEIKAVFHPENEKEKPKK
jgi:hypothetical protein